MKMTSEGTYPRWYNENQIMFASEEFEYKYIISHENLDEARWENGDNRKVDLSNIEGGVVVIEDQWFDAVGEETKVYAQ